MYHEVEQDFLVFQPSSTSVYFIFLFPKLAKLPSYVEATTLPSNEESTTLPSNEEATTLPSNEEATTLPSNEEATTQPSNKEATTLPSNEEATALPSNDEAECIKAPDDPGSSGLLKDDSNAGATSVGSIYNYILMSLCIIYTCALEK